MLTNQPGESESDPAVARVARCLGASPETARVVVARMFRTRRARPAGHGSYHRFEVLAWAAFNAYRRTVVRSGGEDPAWDLFVPTPVEASEIGGNP